METPLQKLYALIALKRETASELFTTHTLQTEFEYNLALLRLEFRYDDEAHYILYEAQELVITEELKALDAKIIHLNSIIEHCSFQISTL